MKILRFLIIIKVIYINADNFIKLWQKRKPYQNKESISGNLKPFIHYHFRPDYFAEVL